MRRFTNAVCMVACLAALTNFVAISGAIAKDRADSETKADKKSVGTQSSELPGCLEKLKLSDDQKTKAKEICAKYDAKIDKAWKRFTEKYMETVRTEVALLAAVEDHLTQAQRDSVRAERHKAAHSEKESDKSQSDNPTSDKSSAGNKPSTNADSSKDASDNSNSKVRKSNGQPQVVVEEVEEVAAGNVVSLTIEQEAIADQVTNKYIGHLRRLHRAIHATHNRLIALEADKLAEIEKLLTKDQLTQLREERQSRGSEHHHVTANDKQSKANE